MEEYRYRSLKDALILTARAGKEKGGDCSPLFFIRSGTGGFQWPVPLPAVGCRYNAV